MSLLELLQGVRAGDLDVVKALVEAGEVDESDVDLALTKAAYHGRQDVARYLLTHGAHVNSADSEGWTPLTQAAFTREVELIRILAEHGADINQIGGGGMPGLIRAARMGHLEVVKCLADLGADLSVPDSDGLSALMWAAYFDNLDVVRYLLSRGVDANAANSDGSVPLMFAANQGHLKVVRYLVHNGANVNAAENGGSTSLMEAAENGHTSVIRFLIKRGADANAVDSDGNTALTFASKHGHNEIQRILAPLSAYTPIRTSSPDKASSSIKVPEWTVSPFDISIDRYIDSGNAGDEFAATWLDAQVSLKLFLPDAANKTFSEEVSVWHKLRHPNVIKLYGACDVGHHFFVCELASHGTVMEHLAGSNPNARTRWRYLHHAALGLGYLHERGITHGYLRASNIVIGSDGLAKLANFSLSGSNRDHSTAESSTLASAIRWQSPEMLKGEPASRSADIYSLGLCVIEIMTDKLLWGKRKDFLVKWDKERWEPDSDLNYASPVDLPDNLGWLIKIMCCQDPTRRETASTCAKIFERLAAEEEERLCATQPEPEPQINVKEYRDGAVAKMWGTVQSSLTQANADNLFLPICRDLGLIYDQVQIIQEQPVKVLEQICSLFADVASAVENSDVANYVLQLSSARATGDNLHAFRQRIASIKWQLGLTVSQEKDADDLDAQNSLPNVMQIYISEESKSWFVAEKLETSEERVVFLTFLHSEITNRASNYSPEQQIILQQAYDDIKRKTEADEQVVVTTPEWFVPWYELIVNQWDTIGSGGFGSVYRAKWLDSEVVVKQLESSAEGQSVSSATVSWASSWSNWNSAANQSPAPDGKEARRQARQMFEREVDIWFRLSHPHVVRLFGACHVGRPFFVCEYAPNGSLEKFLARHPGEIWKKLYEASLGVLFLHERGIVHCDLKCNNVVVGSDNKAKVTDFGLSSATNVHDDGNCSHVTGAWHWVAPELLTSSEPKPSFKSDVYSFGMCIIEALRVIGAERLRDEDAITLPWLALSNEVVKYRSTRGELPPRPALCSDDQWELVEKMCKFGPNERIPMTAVVDELAEIANIRCSKNDTDGDDLPDTTEGMAALVLQMKNRIELETSSSTETQNTLYRVHQLLWSRIEDVFHRTDKTLERRSKLRLLQLVADTRSSTIALKAKQGATHVEFTELALRAYGLHRRLDKLIAAAFVETDIEEAQQLHAWKPKCYKALGADLVAEQL